MGNTSSDYNYYGQGSYQTNWSAKDEHFRFPFPLAAAKDGKDFIVYLSSHRGHSIARMKEGAQEVDFGVYLDGTWKSYLTPVVSEIVVSTGAELPSKVRKVWSPAPSKPLTGVYLPWRDMQACTDSQLRETVHWINEMVDEGLKVEIACIGGHGRTGTLAAALLMSRNPNLHPWSAVEILREVYCKDAVETVAQLNSLYYFAGMEPPPPPVKKETKKYTPAAQSNKQQNSGNNSMGISHSDVMEIRHWLIAKPYEALPLQWEGEEYKRREMLVLP